MRFCTAMFVKVERRRRLRSIITTPRPFKSGRIVFARTDERKHTREVHVRLLAQGVDERKREARRNSNVIQVSAVGELAAISRRAHVCNRKSSGIGIASSEQHTASSNVAALVCVRRQHRPAWRAPQAAAGSSAMRARRGTHRSRRTGAATQSALARTAPSTPSAVPGVAPCYRVRRATGP
jgi:hypothetical protein